MTESMKGNEANWPLRAWVLAAMGAAGGLAIYHLVKDTGDGWGAALRQAAACFIFVGAIIFGHGWERGRTLSAAITAVAGAAIIALVFLWNGSDMNSWSSGEGWRLLAAAVAVFILVPLVQAWRASGADRPATWSAQGVRAWTRSAFPYDRVHDHAWTNVLTLGLSFMFAGLFMLILFLIGSLFDLIGIDLLSKLLREEWAPVTFGGAAIGASTGLMRDRSRILSSLQGVVMIVLRVLAPLVALALALFLVSLLFTGLSPLWDATRSTTPIVLGVAILSILLINAVLGDGEAEAAQAKPLRWGAIVLALCLLPMALIAATSTGLRVGQYGWTPERLWAAVFVGMSLITATAYLVAVVRGRTEWTARLRRTNIGLALTICGIALLLSTPLSSFDAISTRDQIARLKDGRIKVEDFDYKTLWFDFGPSGQAAIKRLAKEGATPEVRRYAADVQKMDHRYAETVQELAAKQGDALDKRLTILPAKVDLPKRLRERLVQYDACSDDGRGCMLRYLPGSDVAVAVADPYETCKNCAPDVIILVRSGDVWGKAGEAIGAQTTPDETKLAAAVRAGKVEVREVRKRQVFIDGEPYGEVFDPSANQSP